MFLLFFDKISQNEQIRFFMTYTQPINIFFIQINGFSLLNETYKKDYNNHSSVDYKALAAQVEPAVLANLKNISEAVILVETKSIMNKSDNELVIGFIVAMKKGKDELPTAEALGKALLKTTIKNKTVNEEATIDAKGIYFFIIVYHFYLTDILC